VLDRVITGISTKFSDRHWPQYDTIKSPYGLSTSGQNRFFNQSSEWFFDLYCPECIRESWELLLSPLAYLIKQNVQYFNEILTRLGQYKVNTVSKSSSKRPFKLPKLKYGGHKGRGWIRPFRGSPYNWFISIWLEWGMVPNHVFQLYFRTNAINNFCG